MAHQRNFTSLQQILCSLLPVLLHFLLEDHDHVLCSSAAKISRDTKWATLSKHLQQKKSKTLHISLLHSLMVTGNYPPLSHFYRLSIKHTSNKQPLAGTTLSKVIYLSPGDTL